MKKQFKFVISVLVLLAISFTAFAEVSPKTFFPALSSNPIYPIDSYLGQTAPENSSSEHILLAEALRTAYSFEWVEEYVAPQSKKMITNLYSTLLSEMLPAKLFVFSKSYKNADNSISISVKLVETNDVISFVLDENKIINISSTKK